MPSPRFTSYWYPLSSSILLVLATSVPDLWPLITIAFVPLFVNIFASQNVRKIIISTLIVGVPYSIAVGESLFRLSGTWWISAPEAIPQLQTIEYMAAIFLVLFFGQAFYLIPMLVASKIKKPIIPMPLLLGLLFALVEFIRSSVFVAGYSWGAIGYLVVDSMYVKYFASLFSVYGLTFVVIVFNAWVASSLMRYERGEGNTLYQLKKIFFAERHAWETITIASLLIAILLFGAYRESQAFNPQLHLRVAVIASDISTEESINETSYETYRSLFMQALEKNPDIILTPENIFPYFIVDEESYTLSKFQSVYLPNAEMLYENFLSLTREYPNTTFALGVHSEKNGLLYNSILLYRDGEVTSTYHKRRPVPFSEYAPLGLDLPLFEKFTKGEAIQDFRLGDILLSAYVCSEIDITPLSAHGAKLILSPSNDSVFVSEGISSLHHRIARMRALENGAFLLRSTKGGISSIIDPYGNTLAIMSEKNGVLFADIP